jgi:nucleotide-binding universal stress UspA family protein
MKIMVCYDKSPQANAALKLAIEHAKVWNAQLLIVNSICRGLPLKHSFIKETEQNLEDEINDLLKETSCPYETHLLISTYDVGEQLVDFAKRNNIDQIFIGIIKKSKVGKLLFGSTAQYVILSASCPVVTIQ